MKEKILNRLPWLFIILSFFFVLILQWHNILSYPFGRGFDAIQHREYIQYLKLYNSVPLPYQGWEMWQPPLYYIVGSLLPNYMVLHYVHLLIWILLGVSSFILFRHIFKDIFLALFGSFLALSLPVILYLTPAISNEFFSAVMISVTMSYYLVNKKQMTVKPKTILGILLGLTILSKATGFLLVGVIFIDQVIENRKNIKNIWVTLSLPFFLMLVIGGWFYLRNLILFGNPFIASIDFPSFAFTSTPEDRGVGFFLNLMPFLKGNLFTAHHESFFPGTFFSFFYDGHNNIVPVQEFSKIGLILVLMAIPFCVLSIIGYIRELTSQKKIVLFLLYIPLLFASYILYNFKLPYYSTVKGAFLVSSVVPWAYFTIRGLEKYKNYVLFFAVYLFLYSVVLLKNFWILSWWYKM